MSIHPFSHWLQTPSGQYLLQWEQAQFNRAVSDVFGYHSVQLGLPELDGLGSNRMPHRWLATQELPKLSEALVKPRDAAINFDNQSETNLSLENDDHNMLKIIHQLKAIDLCCDFAALPFAPSSLDLVLLPHSLELCRDPHATLREVERVLVPEGRVVICCFNPASLWTTRHRLGLKLGKPFLPPSSQSLGYWNYLGYGRLRDWLRLLSFDVESVQFGCFRPAVRSQIWLERWNWMDKVGSRWWPFLGAVYLTVAVKRVRGMRLLEPKWKTARNRQTAAVAPANRNHP